MGVTSDQKPSGKSTHKLTRERHWPHLKSHNKRLTGLLLQVALKCSNCLWAHPGRRGSLTCLGTLKVFNDITAPFRFAPFPLPESFLLFPFSLKDGTIRWWPGPSNPPAFSCVSLAQEPKSKYHRSKPFPVCLWPRLWQLVPSLSPPFHAYMCMATRTDKTNQNKNLKKNVWIFLGG